MLSKIIAREQRQRFYLVGSFAPFALAIESPMAMACFLLLTDLPFFPLFKLPSFSLCIARLTDRCALLPYLAIRYSFLTIALKSILVSMDCLPQGFIF